MNPAVHAAAMAALAGATLAAMEVLTIFAQPGSPRLSAHGVVIMLTWLALAYGVILGGISLVGASVGAPLLRFLMKDRSPSWLSLFGGLALAMAVTIWLRSALRLGERSPAYPVLSLVLVCAALACGATVAALIDDLSRRGAVAAGGGVWLSLLGGLAVLAVLSRSRVGDFGQTGPVPGLGVRLGFAALAGLVIFLVARTAGSASSAWPRRAAAAAVIVWAVFCLPDFSRPLLGAGAVTDAKSGGAIAATGSSDDSRPNVLLISIDTLRADRVSAYGHDVPTTPRLDRLASEGILFARTASVSSFTTPAHASMMTGLFPGVHGAAYQRSNPSAFVIHEILPDVPMLAEILSEEGYETAGFVASPMVGSQFGFNRGFGHFDEEYDRLRSGRGRFLSWTLLFRVMRRGGVLHDRDVDSERGADEVNARALAWWSGREADRPFFMFVHYYDPHAPYEPPAGHDPGGNPDPSLANLDMNALLRREYTLTEKARQDVLSLYDAEIHAVDARVGEILDRLEEAGDLERTLVIVTSDHGESFGEHGHWGHNMFLYEDLLGIPFIVRPPGGLDGGRVVEEVVAQPTDILPTVLSRIGVRPPDGTQGRDLSRYLGAGGAEPPAGLDSPLLAFADLERNVNWGARWGAHLDRDLASARADRWKYILSSTGEEELYDLETDPGETQNLVRQERDTLHSMRELLESWRSTLDPAGARGAPSMDEGVIESLRSLGYVQ